MHIRNRNELICWLENNAPSKAIARAIQEGQVENLGGFFRIPPSIIQGWIIKVTSRFNKTWYITVQVPRITFYVLKARIIDVVPWDEWAGDQSSNKLYCGDDPKKYKELRENAKQTEPDS